MSDNKSFLAIDLGEKRAGLAFSVDGKTVLPGGQLSIDRQDWSGLAKAIKERQPDCLVFGLPLDKEGKKTQQARWIEQEAEKIGKKVDLPVEFVDEYLSSWQAMENIKKVKTDSGDKSKEVVDEQAACIILSDYLENLE